MFGSSGYTIILKEMLDYEDQARDGNVGFFTMFLLTMIRMNMMMIIIIRIRDVM